jgi:hypothetical protein
LDVVVESFLHSVLIPFLFDELELDDDVDVFKICVDLVENEDDDVEESDAEGDVASLLLELSRTLWLNASELKLSATSLLSMNKC